MPPPEPFWFYRFAFAVGNSAIAPDIAFGYLDDQATGACSALAVLKKPGEMPTDQLKTNSLQ